MEDNTFSQDEIDALINAMSGKNANNSEDSPQNPPEDTGDDFQADSKPLLSQDEIEALLKISQNTQKNPQNKRSLSPKIISSKRRQANIGVYDFTMPSRLSNEHLKSLNALHSRYAKTLSSYLSVSLRTTVDIDCINIEQMTYGEYLTSAFDPTCIGIFSMKPLRGIGLLEINMPLAFPIIDTLLGGTGAPKFFNRSLTVVEESIITKIMEKALSILQDSWQRSIDLSIKLERVENNTQFIQTGTSGDPVILILFDVKLNNARGMMSICFPFLTMQQVLSSLKREGSQLLVDDEAMKSCQNVIKDRIKKIYLPISVKYEPSPVTLGELLELKKGDVIILQNAKRDQVLVFVANKKKYIGKPGIINGKRAVQISSVENDEGIGGITK